MRHNVDHFDGHMLVSEYDLREGLTPGHDAELVHHVEHPPTCPPSHVLTFDDGSTYIEWRCIPQEHHHNCGEWPEAITPGRRVIGYRVDKYPGGPWGATEYDVVAFTVGPAIQEQPMTLTPDTQGRT